MLALLILVPTHHFSTRRFRRFLSKPDRYWFRAIAIYIARLHPVKVTFISCEYHAFDGVLFLLAVSGDLSERIFLLEGAQYD